MFIFIGVIILGLNLFFGYNDIMTVSKRTRILSSFNLIAAGSCINELIRAIF